MRNLHHRKCLFACSDYSAVLWSNDLRVLNYWQIFLLILFHFYIPSARHNLRVMIYSSSTSQDFISSWFIVENSSWKSVKVHSHQCSIHFLLCVFNLSSSLYILNSILMSAFLIRSLVVNSFIALRNLISFLLVSTMIRYRKAMLEQLWFCIF